MTCEELLMIKYAYSGGIVVSDEKCKAIMMFEKGSLPDWADQLLSGMYRRTEPDDYNVYFIEEGSETQTLRILYHKYFKDDRNSDTIEELSTIIIHRYLLCPNIIAATGDYEFTNFMGKFMNNIIDKEITLRSLNGAGYNVGRDYPTRSMMLFVSAFWYIAKNAENGKISEFSLSSSHRHETIPSKTIELDVSNWIYSFARLAGILQYSKYFLNIAISENHLMLAVASEDDIEAYIYNYWRCQMLYANNIDEGFADILKLVNKGIFEREFSDIIHRFVAGYLSNVYHDITGEWYQLTEYDYIMNTLMYLFSNVDNPLFEKDANFPIYKPLEHSVMYTYSEFSPLSSNLRDIINKSTFWFYDEFGNICCNSEIYDELVADIHPMAFTVNFNKIKSLEQFPALYHLAKTILLRYDKYHKLSNWGKSENVEFDDDVDVNLLAYAILVLGNEYAFCTAKDDIIEREVLKVSAKQLGNEKMDEYKPEIYNAFRLIIKSFDVLNSKMEYIVNELGVGSIVWDCAMQQVYYMLTLAYKKQYFRSDILFEYISKNMVYMEDENHLNVDFGSSNSLLAIAMGENNTEYQNHLIYLAMMNDDMFGHNAACTYVYSKLASEIVDIPYYHEWANNTVPYISDHELVSILSCNSLPTLVYDIATKQLKKILRKFLGLHSRKFRKYCEIIDNMRDSYRTRESLLPYIAGYFEDAIDVRYAREFAKVYIEDSIYDNLEIISGIRDFGPFSKLLDLLREISTLPENKDYCEVFPIHYIYDITRDIRDIVKNE